MRAKSTYKEARSWANTLAVSPVWLAKLDYAGRVSPRLTCQNRWTISFHLTLRAPCLIRSSGECLLT